MAGLIRKLGDGLLKWSEQPIAHDPHGIQITQAFGNYFKTLPDRWALAKTDLVAFRKAFPNMRVGDITGEGGTFIAGLLVLYYGGYLIGLGNRTPFSYRLTGWSEAHDRITGWNGKYPENVPQAYNTPYRYA